MVRARPRRTEPEKIRVARSETAREFNRRVVLNLVRRHQPISRAALARRSGMQRSTVSAIAEELIGQRWLVEGAVGHLPRGRKPTFLHLNSERAGIIGVDIQPRVTTLAVGTVDSRLISQEQIPTGHDASEFVARLARRVHDLMRAYPRDIYEGIGVSVPGRIEASSHRLIFAPNLGWNDVDLKGPLEKATGLEVEVENAANACAIAQLWSGIHGHGVSNLVAVTVSDGIGVGIVANGQLVRGSNGAAGEFGHVALFPDGPLCHCGNRGCWEVFGSNAAAVRFYSESARGRKDAGSKSDTAKITFIDLLRLADQGDEKALNALRQMAQHLGAGLAMLVTGLAPEILLVAGEVTRAWPRIGPIVLEAAQSKSFTHANTRILATDPDAQPRLQGTIALVLEKHFDTVF